ncbi:MAG TPA: hypothetical protein VHR84_01465 [Terriglobales bacterium]|nr:hypothetical protein [Terriglobales bacterium]
MLATLPDLCAQLSAMLHQFGVAVWGKLTKSATFDPLVQFLRKREDWAATTLTKLPHGKTLLFPTLSGPDPAL